jgi:hypothetical protein
MFCARHLLHVPRLVVFHQGIEKSQALAHAGRQRDLLGCARGAQALINLVAPGVVPDRAERTPVQGRPAMGAPAPCSMGPPSGATGPVAGGHADEGREALAASGAPRWAGEHPRPRPHRPTAWDTAGQSRAFAPDGARPSRGLPVVIQGRPVRIEPGNMGHAVGLQATRRVLEAVLRGGPHREALPPPRQKGTPLFGLCVWPRAGGRPPGLRQVSHGTGSAGRTACRRLTRAAIPVSSFVIAQRAPVGRRAISRCALATSRPTKP